jgi:hypothetical protein
MIPSIKGVPQLRKSNRHIVQEYKELISGIFVGVDLNDVRLACYLQFGRDFFTTHGARSSNMNQAKEKCDRKEPGGPVKRVADVRPQSCAEA